MTAAARPAPPIQGYDHVGIRVSDRAEALEFYGRIGFALTTEYPDYQALELRSDSGIFINLITNAVRRPGRTNVLYDEPTKYPGTTHPCFIVENLDTLAAWLAAEGIAVTEGPVATERRRCLFLRDPDGNVLEYTELR